MNSNTLVNGALNGMRESFRAKMERDKGKRLFIKALQAAAAEAAPESVRKFVPMLPTFLAATELKNPAIREMWKDVPECMEFLRVFVRKYDEMTSE